MHLTAFVVVCGIGAFALVAIYGQLRFENERTYNAVFTTVSGLQNGNFVRIAGVEVGKVKNIQIANDDMVRVTLSADDSVVLTQGTKAVIRYADLIGGPYLALEEGPGPTAKLPPGGTIKVANTAPALDLDALIGGFRPLLRALDPTQVNTLTSQLIAAFQGQGATIGSILAQTASLTNTLADRDALIGQVVVNLNTVLGSLADTATSSAPRSIRCRNWCTRWPNASKTSSTASPMGTRPRARAPTCCPRRGLHYRKPCTGPTVPPAT